LKRIARILYVMARELDRHYVPSRYPNAFESGYPGMYYDEPTATRVIRSAEVIVEGVRVKLAKLGVKP